jgi:hypothetical protein
MAKRPSCYRAPLRSRKDIIAFLMGHDNYYRHAPSTNSPLAWNVRDYDSDLSAAHLIEVYRRDVGDEPWLDFPEWRQPALAKYEEVKDKLWDWAIEDARRRVQDDEAYRYLWDGTPIDVEYRFVGRSGGWLVLTKFEGDCLENIDEDEFPEYLETLPYPMLRKLYHLVVQNDHDFRREAVAAEIEHAAAWSWIEGTCSDVPRPERTQRELPLSE